VGSNETTRTFFPAPNVVCRRGQVKVYATQKSIAFARFRSY